MSRKWKFLALLLLPLGAAHADQQMEQSIERLQHEWAIANYQAQGDGKEAAFKALSEMARQVSQANPGKAEPLIWEAIIVSGYAGARGGLGALDLVKKARELLLAAEKIDPQALGGSAYTTLGSLYYKVPGWPISFGDRKKAREYLEKSLQINPGGIDPNYFYGEFLLEQGEYAKAADFLRKALVAPARPGREEADSGRRAEARQLLKQAEKRLGES